jgi:radical SAM superfamily enzyme YgiQ (UPF0313 family)
VKILLVYPDSRLELIEWGELGAIAEPLALEYVATAALADGHEVRILDLRLRRTSLEACVAEFRPDVLGLTGYSMHVLRMKELARQCKRLLPECRVVVGGHHATLLPEDFFVEFVDFVAAGEGISSFRSLLASIEKNEACDKIPGLWCRTDGNIFSFGGTPPAFAIDELPMPNRDLLSSQRDQYFIDRMRPIALLRTTVGCPYRCSFCSLWRIMDGRYHKRTISHVIEELSLIREPNVFLVDDEPFIDARRITLLAEAIRVSGIRKRYFAYCRIDTLIRQRDILVAWREIGLDRIFLGIEAVSASELTEYNKAIEVVEIERALAVAKDLGLNVFAQFMVHPRYTKDDFRRLVRFIEYNDLDSPWFTILTPIPAGGLLPDFSNVSERQSDGRPNWELFDFQHVVSNTRLPIDVFVQEYRSLWRHFYHKFHRPSRPPATMAHIQ